MINTIIIAMASQTTANYIITSTIALPAIIAMNDILPEAVPVLEAHMFVFYFGIVADITQPVAFAAFASYGISGGVPIQSGYNTMIISLTEFIFTFIVLYTS